MAVVYLVLNVFLSSLMFLFDYTGDVYLLTQNHKRRLRKWIWLYLSMHLCLVRNPIITLFIFDCRFTYFCLFIFSANEREKKGLIDIIWIFLRD